MFVWNAIPSIAPIIAVICSAPFASSVIVSATLLTSSRQLPVTPDAAVASALASWAPCAVFLAVARAYRFVWYRLMDAVA